ncbi:GNAT family N-acetyltransferase [Pseudalkalibacillus sp. A8]|uniref:GNAT family N-acetyltransferase n=1 Tax=Pseudalkalibacillus sp. A8 TaxID=3382641 RepID=UPI0038B4F127
MEIVSTQALNKQKIEDFFLKQWGSPRMVLSTGTYDCDTLDGFTILDGNGEIIGLLTYIIEKDECEIISLDSIQENKGIGSTLIRETERHLKTKDCKKIKLITTNDNLRALKFYQKRGYQLTQVFPNAVEKSRRIKPEIPLTAANGIPIRDDLLSVKTL